MILLYPPFPYGAGTTSSFLPFVLFNTIDDAGTIGVPNDPFQTALCPDVANCWSPKYTHSVPAAFVEYAILFATPLNDPLPVMTHLSPTHATPSTELKLTV